MGQSSKPLGGFLTRVELSSAWSSLAQGEESLDIYHLRTIQFIMFVIRLGWNLMGDLI